MNRSLRSGIVIALATGLALFTPAASARAGALQDMLDLPAWLQMSGSMRARYEHLDAQFRPGLPPDDHQLNLRVTLRASVERGRGAALVEVFDGRSVFEREGGTRSTGDVNALEPVQALVRMRFGDADARAWRSEVSLGRFTVDIGSRRLIGRNNFRNTTNAFTGVLVNTNWSSGRTLTSFFAAPQRRRPTAADAIERDVVQIDRESFDQRLWALHLSGVNGPGSLQLAPYVIGLDERDADDLATRDRHLVTIGTQLVRAPKQASLTIDTELALQFGKRRASTSAADERDLDVFAWMLHAGARLRPPSFAPWSIETGIDAASGDRDPQDDKNTRFDNLFGPRRPDWGPTGLYGALGPANIVSPYLRVDRSGGGRWSHFARHRVLWLAQERDAFAATGVVDATGESGRFAGHQSEARSRCWLVRDRARLELGAAVLWAGDFLQDAPNAAGGGDSWYGHVDLEFWF